MFREKGRITTSKTRFFNNDTPLLRVDHELRMPISEEMQDTMIKEVKHILKITDVCILQDYNKGVLTTRMIEEIMDMAKKEGVPVFVDPKIENIDLYKGAFLIKPNRHEAEIKLGYAGMEGGAYLERDLFGRPSIIVHPGYLKNEEFLIDGKIRSYDEDSPARFVAKLHHELYHFYYYVNLVPQGMRCSFWHNILYEHVFLSHYLKEEKRV